MHITRIYISLHSILHLSFLLLCTFPGKELVDPFAYCAPTMPPRDAPLPAAYSIRHRITPVRTTGTARNRPETPVFVGGAVTRRNDQPPIPAHRLKLRTKMSIIRWAFLATLLSFRGGSTLWTNYIYYLPSAFREGKFGSCETIRNNAVFPS